MNEETAQSKKRIWKYILNVFLFIFLIYLTFSFLLRNEDIDELYATIGSAKPQFVLIGLLCMVLYYLFESINMRRTLCALGEKCTIMDAMKYSLIGAFFSAITPAASGGQPMQIIFMHRDGIKVSSSTPALLYNLLSFQVITITMELVAAAFLHEYMDAGIIALFIVGAILNFSSLVLIIIGMTSKKLSSWLVKVAAKTLKLFRVKNYEKKEASMMEALENYHESAKLIREDRRILVKQLSTSLVQQIVYYTIPFLVLLAFGLPSQSYLLMLGLQSIVFGSVSGIPSPGAVGVSEGAFQSIFKPIFTENFINSAMVLHRLISFYIPVSICAIVVLVATFTWNKRKNK